MQVMIIITLPSLPPVGYFVSGIVFPIFRLAHIHCTNNMPEKLVTLTQFGIVLVPDPCAAPGVPIAVCQSTLVSFLIKRSALSMVLSPYCLGIASFRLIALALFQMMIWHLNKRKAGNQTSRMEQCLAQIYIYPTIKL
jgi:hypothetical protein